MHDYYAFGLEASDPTQDAEPTRFTSQETDLQNTSGQADDLVNMHARFYHPILARFLSADLLSGNPHSPQSFNLFAYVRGNPANYWDPYGMEFKFWGRITVAGDNPCPEAPEGVSCQTWWDILAAGGWASRNDFMSGTPPDWLNESTAGMRPPMALVPPTPTPTPQQGNADQTPCVPMHQRRYMKVVEGLAGVDMIETGDIVVLTGGAVLVASFLTSESYVTPAVGVPVGVFLVGTGGAVGWSGFRVAGDAMGLWDLGYIPPPCPQGGGSSQ